MLFPLLLFLQMTGISSSLCGVSPKAPPCGCQMWCHRKGTVTEMISLLSLLLCSPFLPLTLYCAGRAPLHQPQPPSCPAHHSEVVPTPVPLGSPATLHGHTWKIPFLLGSAQPQYPRPKSDSTGAWDFQSIFQK